MFSDNRYAVSSVTASNIKSLIDKQSVITEQIICELSELAASVGEYLSDMLVSGYGIYEALGFISDSLPIYKSEPRADFLEDNLERIKATVSAMDASSRAVFSELLLENLRQRGRIVSESDFLSQSRGNEVIAYVRNSLSDEAYDVFSEELSYPKVKYFKTLAESVGSVVSGESEYCLLPLEERGGIRLFLTSGFIVGEDLKIASVTPVFGYDGNADMKYALISKHFNIPVVNSDDDRYFEFRFSKDDTRMSLSDLLICIEVFGITVYRINTQGLGTNNDETERYSVVLKNEGGDFTKLILFLTLFCDSYVPVGIYKNLE
jgi:hypothetical protein